MNNGRKRLLLNVTFFLFCYETGKIYANVPKEIPTIDSFNLYLRKNGFRQSVRKKSNQLADQLSISLYVIGGLVSTGSRRSPTHSLPSLCLSASVPTEVDLVSMEISGPEPRRD